MIDVDNSFDEAAYLAANPDVVKAISIGKFVSGWDHYCSYGKAEGRLGRPVSNLTVRVMKANAALSLEGPGLEIGPSHSPIAPKKQGYNVRVLDRATAAELRAGYVGHDALGVDVDNIEEVDFVWRGEPLPELTGKRAYYEWIIASHVVEHVPDLVSFLQQCEALLTQDGKMWLVVPDRRYCFDFLGKETSTGDVLDAFTEKRTRPTPGKVFDYIANSVRRDGQSTWGDTNIWGKLTLIHGFDHAKELWERARNPAEYIDVHCWRFTPESFIVVVGDLQALGLIGMTLTVDRAPNGSEFYVTMTREASRRTDDRLAALVKMSNAR